MVRLQTSENVQAVLIEEANAFQQVLHHLEKNDDETVTLDELYQIIKAEAGDDAYSRITLKRRLEAHEDSITITCVKQQPLIVTLSTIVNNSSARHTRKQKAGKMLLLY